MHKVLASTVSQDQEMQDENASNEDSGQEENPESDIEFENPTVQIEKDARDYMKWNYFVPSSLSYDAKDKYIRFKGNTFVIVVMSHCTTGFILNDGDEDILVNNVSRLRGLSTRLDFKRQFSMLISRHKSDMYMDYVAGLASKLILFLE